MEMNFRDKSIYYEVYGEGEALILLNGIMMSTRSWYPFIENLSNKNKLVLLDLLDQGMSDKMEEGYDLDLQAEVVYELIKELKLEKVTIVGISYGGSIALRLAINYQHVVKKLILFNTTAATNPWLRDIGEGWKKSGYSAEAFYNVTIPPIYSPGFYNKKREWMDIRKNFLIKKVFSNESFINSMKRLIDSSANHDIIYRLKEIKVPTLVVGCEEDFITPLSEQKLLHKNIENSHLIIIPNCGHASMYEKPVIFNSTILGFMNMVNLEFSL